MNVLILGQGRIGQAILHYLKKFRATKKVAFFSDEKEIKKFDLLIGALPGETGGDSLRLALKYKKNLIDLADLEPEFYFKKKKRIGKKKILVIPNCGFCPGLINLILGAGVQLPLKAELPLREISKNKNLSRFAQQNLDSFGIKKIKKIEVKAGTLSPKRFFFPFLWCFEDLILEHQIHSWQMISGKRIKFPPFSGYQREKFFGIEAESYFAQSGFENLAQEFNIKNFIFKVIRPLGFFHFYQFLENHGFLEGKNLKITQGILEGRAEDNLTLAEIKILTQDKETTWRIKSFSKKREKLNSMQKIAGLMPAIISKFILGNKFKSLGGEDGGILLMEDIGKDEDLFQEILKKLKREKIFIQRKESRFQLHKKRKSLYNFK